MSDEKIEDIQLPGFGRVIGYLKPWDTDPDVYDGWLEVDREGSDRLVLNGGDRDRVCYQVIQEHLAELLALLDAERRNGHCMPRETRRRFEHEAMDCLTAMRAALRNHFERTARQH